MEPIFILLAIALAAHPVITPLILIGWNLRLKREIEQQDRHLSFHRASISRLERQVAGLGEETLKEEGTSHPTAESPPDAPEPDDADRTDDGIDDSPEDTPDELVARDADDAPSDGEGEEPAKVESLTPIPVIARKEKTLTEPGSTKDSLEKTLTSSWMIWLGALAIGLSAVFLFTYAVEQGWFGPVARVAMGVALGVALIASGEWTHRRSIDALARVRGHDYIPAALTASGVFALYVSFFAAHALYLLYGEVVSFLMLAGVSFAGLLLALRQGPFVAVMALGGGYLVPALIASDAPAATPVFLYLFVLTSACLALMMYRKWWFLSYATLIGALGWPLLWMLGPWVLADQGVLGAYALGVAALFATFSVNLPVKTPQIPAMAWLLGLFSNTSGLGFALSGSVVILLSIAADYNEASYVILGLFAVIGVAFGLRRAAYEGLAVTSVLVVALAVFLWPQPDVITLPTELQRLGVDSYKTAFGPYVMPPEFLSFARALAVFAVGVGLGCAVAMRSAATPAVWSALAASAPNYFFVIGYWRIGGFEVDVAWATIAMGLAAFNLAAAAYTRRNIGGRAGDACVAFFATGCTTALALAFTCLFREAWLTVALSVEVLALAWIWSELRVRELRAIILVTVGVVVTRLILNHNVLDYEGGAFWAFSWVIYGYGVPALAFHLAARFLGEIKDDPLAALCEIAAIAFGFLMVALQLRVWTTGAISSPNYDLFDQAVQSVWWLIAGGLLLRREINETLPQARYGGLLLLGAAALQILLGHILWHSPLLRDEPVGSWPLLNTLGLAYLAPAILFGALASSNGFLLARRIRMALAMFAGILLFLYLSLEARRAFHAEDLSLFSGSAMGSAELYAYSAVWIAYALSLLAVGVIKKVSFWRYASLAVLIVTVLKVFLFDMSDLEGLFRVASFLGLGLTLIGIGYVYRRFVFR